LLVFRRSLDPKPFIGDPAYDATQHLLNCIGRLRAEPLSTIQRFAELLGVDSERVRMWAFARLAAEPRDDGTDWKATEMFVNRLNGKHRSSLQKPTVNNRVCVQRRRLPSPLAAVRRPS
jgi:hypothetical protein